ncbi:MAG TPA: protein-disulfide reductase DsbD family protein [Rhodoblastus sp.]|nr:protein-disulfide reductase DsbD family protein [Rhodoblastus sp.]
MPVMRIFTSLAAAISLSLTLSAAEANPAADKARVSFVSGGGLANGAYQAAIVIDLAPDTTTYWRNPGDAGSPPSFDFSASDNLASADVAMPAPKRIEEAGLDVFGYRSRVVFPVAITPKDAGKPVAADLKMDYAACEKICIPMHAEARLELAPAGEAGADVALVAAARAAVPKAVAPEEAATLAPRAGADKPTWTVTPKTAGALDLFAEPPDGYFAETKREAGGAFRLTLAEAPKDAPVPKGPVRLTLTTPTGALEFSVRLDGGRASP